MGREGERLRVLRDRHRLSQQALADLSGIEREKIAKIETGTRRMSATDAAYLAQALAVRTDDLVGRPEPRARFRLSEPDQEDQAQAVADWFEDFIKDAFFLERSAKRHGIG